MDINFLHNRVEKNRTEYKKYLNEKLSSFCELESLRNENIYCLILEFYQASIFTTNHLLERLLKLALIKNHTKGYNYSKHEEYNQRNQEAINMFDGITLNNSLERCFELSLISEEQKTELKKLKDSFRNPYSHAETAKINNENPEHIRGFMFNFNDVKKNIINQEKIKIPKPIHISKHSPAIAQLFQENNSKENALIYFEKVSSYIQYFEEKYNSY